MMITLSAALLVCTGASCAAADCRLLAANFQTAVQAADLDSASRLVAELEREASCEETFLRKVRRVAAVAHYKEAQRRMTAGDSPASQEDILRRAAAFSPIWPVLTQLGDIEHDRRHYDRAAEYYQKALNDIDNPVTTPNPPPVDSIKRIYERANQSRLLADTFTAAPLTRDGAPGGVAMSSIRGFEPRIVPVPITFQTDTAAFTVKGQQAAEEMAAILAAEKPAKATIVGHTDPRGSREHNQKLSERRAQAVAGYLRSRGVAVSIEAVGRGSSEPFQPDDPSRYTMEERWQMDRRVELRR
jgi:outer membrane protein OmpA-like peptidoglycan-associated protein